MDQHPGRRRAVIMGGSDGLGFAVAHALAREGTEVCLLARNEARLAAACQKISDDTGVLAHAIPADLSQKADVHKAVDAISTRIGAPDILIGNGGGPPPNRADNYDASGWQYQFDTMLYPMLHFTDAFLPSMRKNGFGRIIMISSISVIRPLPGLAFSNTFRAALANWGKTLALEVAADGITVNTLMPGLFDTARLRALQASQAAPTPHAKQSSQPVFPSIPIGRNGRPEELGSIAAFLASAHASYVTGTLIPVDGGLLLKS